jgi:acetylornithine deacetylase/succinyl-diaminopimelate desuccinylase-like protein
VNNTAIYEYVDAHLDQTIEELQELISVPTVSGTSSDMQRGAELVASHYKSLGCTEVEIVDTPTQPGVWAYFDAGATLTLASYGMYDVQPVGQESEWEHAPFGGTLASMGDLPAVIYGRGALVPKGPHIAWMAALKAIHHVTGTLPVNIMFLTEGDEIVGSPSYLWMIERYDKRLEEIDACFYLRAAQNRRGEVPLVLGYKSFITLELEASGERWGRGPTTGPAHSATAPIVDSVPLRLARALSSLYTDAGDIGIPQWREVLALDEIPEADTESFRALADMLTERPLDELIPGLAGAGVSRFHGSDEAESALQRYIYGSSLNIQGIRSGYIGPGTRTFTSPERAIARLDARLVTSASPEELVSGLRDHLQASGFGDIEVNVLGSYPGSRTAPESGLVKAFLRAADRAGAQVVVWPIQGYGGPWSVLSRRYGADVVFATGIGCGGGVGQADEYLVIDGGGTVPGLREMIHFCVDVVLDYAGREMSRRPAIKAESEDGS